MKSIKYNYQFISKEDTMQIKTMILAQKLIKDTSWGEVLPIKQSNKFVKPTSFRTPSPTNQLSRGIRHTLNLRTPQISDEYQKIAIKPLLSCRASKPSKITELDNSSYDLPSSFMLTAMIHTMIE
ncbi:hypothetical protein SS50377_23896 [Spironucleus salmonicida]|uniref:Uncharacterized protein n=1 Tax=Spironucleus salmonicida TaxID=348837 RepID=V6LUQ7_9EUKA|nr:hypothetical protein SS50377_23896 [Spironucleus salmonicida]|eukprot:EST48300.1 Hypothetical protein SS50377_11499 [Spironucleus salmonicida]